MNEKEKKYVEKIVGKYEIKEKTKLDKLRFLDRKTRIHAKVFAYIFGCVSSLILGFGMCIAMKVILEDFMWLGIVIGLLGILLLCFNYPIYKKIEEKNKKKYSKEILTLSDELLNENK